MLRFAIALLVALAVTGSAMGADRSFVRRGWHRTTVILPPGLPRPHYNFRTTISYEAPYPYPRRYYAYYGSAYTYEYQSPYYGGPYVSYWDRLPYACGAYGYC